MVVYCVNKHIEAIVQCNPRWKFLALMQCKRCLDGFVVVRAAEIVNLQIFCLNFFQKFFNAFSFRSQTFYTQKIKFWKYREIRFAQARRMRGLEVV